MDTTRVAHDERPDDTEPPSRPGCCIDGTVFIGHLVEADGEEVEVFEPYPCRRCRE